MGYTIQSGDTLSSIAKKNGTDINSIMKANPHISNPNQIIAGSSLTIPSVAPTPVSSPSVNSSSPGTGAVGIRDALTQQGYTVGWDAKNGVSVDGKNIDTTGWNNIGGKYFATQDQIKSALDKAGVQQKTVIPGGGAVTQTAPKAVLPGGITNTQSSTSTVMPGGITVTQPPNAPATNQTLPTLDSFVKQPATTGVGAALNNATKSYNGVNYNTGTDYQAEINKTTDPLLIKALNDARNAKIAGEGLTQYAANPTLSSNTQPAAVTPPVVGTEVANDNKIPSANSPGTVGLRETLEAGGHTVNQDPTTGVVTVDGKAFDTTGFTLRPDGRWEGPASIVTDRLNTLGLKQEAPIKTIGDTITDTATNQNADTINTDKLNAIITAIRGMAAPTGQLSYADAMKQAGDQLNPQYDERMKALNKTNDYNSVQSGFFGQIPQAVLNRSSQVQETGQRNSAVSGLANQMVQQSEQNALTKSAQDQDMIKTALSTMTQKEQQAFTNALSAGQYTQNKTTQDITNEGNVLSNQMKNLDLKYATQIKQGTIDGLTLDNAYKAMVNSNYPAEESAKIAGILANTEGVKLSNEATAIANKYADQINQSKIDGQTLQNSYQKLINAGYPTDQAEKIAQGWAQIKISQQNANTGTTNSNWAMDPNNPDNASKVSIIAKNADEKTYNNNYSEAVGYYANLDPNEALTKVTANPAYEISQIGSANYAQLVKDLQAKIAKISGSVNIAP